MADYPASSIYAASALPGPPFVSPEPVAASDVYAGSALPFPVFPVPEALDASEVYDASALVPPVFAVPMPHVAQMIYSAAAGAPATPPTISNLLPPTATPIDAYGAISVDVTDPLGPATVSITATYSNGITETVFSGGVLVAPYVLGGSVSPIVNGVRIQFRRGTGFYAGLSVNVGATGLGGGVANAAASYLVLSPATNPAPDITAPVVTGALPAPGSTIDPSTAIQFDVTDDGGAFRRIIISVLFEQTGMEEVAYDGDGFRGLYLGLSATQIVSGGLHFSLVRKEGWPYSPTIKVFAIDTSGNEGDSTVIPLILPS